MIIKQNLHGKGDKITIRTSGLGIKRAMSKPSKTGAGSKNQRIQKIQFCLFFGLLEWHTD